MDTPKQDWTPYDVYTTEILSNTQTAVMNIINLRIIYKLDVSYASQHTFSKVTVTIFWQLYIYDSDKVSGTEIKEKQS